MNPVPDAVGAQLALSRRLRSVAPILLGPGLLTVIRADPASDAAEVFELLVSAIETTPTEDRIWLLLSALSAVYPTRGEISDVRRQFELDPPIVLRMHLLDQALDRVREYGTALTEVALITGGVIVDVDHSAKHELHTGIQRVARKLLPLWDEAHTITPVVWAGTGTAYRALGQDEADRVIRWDARNIDDDAALTKTTASVAGHGPAPAESPSILLPWRSIVVMVEVPQGSANDRLAAVGSCSGNKLVGIAYDAIPIVSADAVPPVESMKFARYLTAVKFASRMAGISVAASAEIAGFVRMLPTQGLVGPIVSEVSLPAGPSARKGPHPTRERQAIPMLLSVGSHEPRKNHLAILYAAEVLWREGLRFSLQFVGGSGWGDDFPRLADDLKAAGRPVEVRKGVTDWELDRAYDEAAFTIFPSLHEGYGLPVAESMAHGTPVITSNFGSMAEIGSAGGAVLIDPRDDVALTDAIRKLLTVPSELARLVAAIADRPARSWSDYASELWDAIVQPELAGLARAPAEEPIEQTLERA